MVFSPSLRETGVMDDRIIRLEGRGAQVQYRVLMALYSIVFNRWLYGIFCRALARFFDPDNKVVLDLGDDFPVDPQLKGALRSLGGVLEVEDA